MAKALKRKEIIATLQEKYPKFNKVAMSMASHPERYGVCLTKEAKEYLGIEKQKKKPNRKKNHQLTIRIGDELFTALMEFCEREEFSIQDAVEIMIAIYTQE